MPSSVLLLEEANLPAALARSLTGQPVVPPRAGRSSVVTTMRYAHFAPKHEADPMERLAASTATATANSDSGEITEDSQTVDNDWWRRVESNSHRP